MFDFDGEWNGMAESQSKTQHGRKVVWGTAGIKSAVHSVTTSGIVQSCSVTNNAEKEEIQDEEGETCTVVIGNKTKSLDITVVCETTTKAPEAGNTLTGSLTDFGIDLTKGTLIVDEGVKEDWTNNGAKQLSFQATYYPNIAPETV